MTILHTNDVHGHYWRDERGEHGFAGQRAVIERVRREVREQGGHVLVLSAGDINTGDPRSDVFDAEPDIRAMNLMGYDAMTIGNHEFDKPNATLRRQALLAKFPMLSANIYVKGTDQHAFPSYVIKDFAGFKVAIVGLTTEDTPQLADVRSTGAFDFRPAIEEAKALLPRLKREADLVVVLSHLGYYAHESHGENAPGDVSLALRTRGADVIVGGHSHTALEAPDLENGTIIVQAGQFGEHLGRLDLEVEGGRVVDHHYSLLPINTRPKGVSQPQSQSTATSEEPLAEDPEMLALLAPYREAAEAELRRRIGRAEGSFLGKDSGARGETALGRLVARAQRAMVRADVGIVNHGGLRSSFGTGDIDYTKILQTQPFRNTLCVCELSAADLANYLDSIQRSGKRKLFHLDGLRIVRLGRKLGRLEIGGRPVDPRDPRRFRLVLNSHSALGGDGWPDLSRLPSFKNTQIPDALALARFIEAQGTVRAADFAEPSVIQLGEVADSVSASTGSVSSSTGSPRESPSLRGASERRTTRENAGGPQRLSA